MAKLLKLRRGTTSQHSSFTGAEGECTVDTTKDTLVVHDGAQAGGRPLLREDLNNIGTGVVTHAIDSEHYANGSIDTDHIGDNQVTLAKMAGIARGKIIYGDSSGNPAVLAVGSSGQTIVSDGTDISWGTAAAGATGGGNDTVFWENGQTVTTNYTITNNYNAMSAGPITINNGIVVTIGTGENWTIV